MIAEISDKMHSIPTMWVITAVLAAPFLVGVSHRWVAWGLLPVAIIFSGILGYGAYRDAFTDAGMIEAIRNEMGWWWIINSLSSTLLPLLVAVVALMWAIKKKRKPKQVAGV